MKKKIITLLVVFLFCSILTQAQKSVRDSLKEFTMAVVQNAMKRGKIKNLAVWDFTNMNKEITLFGSYIAEQFSVYAENIDSLALMDRQNLKSLLNEHKLKSEGFIDKNTIMKLGQFKEVDAVAVGSVIIANKDFQVVVKIIETSFGRTIAADEQFFPIDKSISAILGIENTGSVNSKTNNLQNTSNRGFNGKPLNSNEEYNDPVTVSKDCLTKKTGDYCFTNTRAKEVEIHVRIVDNNNFTKDHFNAILSPNQTQCFYNLKAAIFSYSISDGKNNGWNVIQKGQIKIEECKSKTFTIK